MIPFGNQTVTLLHRQNDSYKRYMLFGCSWHESTSRTMNDTAVQSSLETTCRIPSGQQIPVTGDLLILGSIKAAAVSEIDLIRLMQSLRESGKSVFRVQQVRNNALGTPIPHYAAAGM